MRMCMRINMVSTEPPRCGWFEEGGRKASTSCVIGRASVARRLQRHCLTLLWQSSSIRIESLSIDMTAVAYGDT